MLLRAAGLHRDLPLGPRHGGRPPGRDGPARLHPEIAEAARAGDADAAATLDRYVQRLGRGLATVVNVLDPDVVVLGGGMSNLPGLARRAEEAMRPWIFTDAPTTPVVLHHHGDASGVRGAAWLW